MSNLILNSIFIILSLCRLNEESFKVSTIANIDQISVNYSEALSVLCKKYLTLNNKIRDGKIESSFALQEIRNQIPKIKAAYFNAGGKIWKKNTWIFPVQYYNATSIGGSNGSGYISNGYNFFAGNKHGGHPAHDIFIQDRNQDSKDEKTNKYVNVLSFSGGVVVATETIWNIDSKLRGGKYIWIFDPSSNSLFYYAHCNNVLVICGQIITPGQIIATVGRTGLNAYKQRSPTHLHFSRLEFDRNYCPIPVDTYNDLLIAKNQ